MVIFFKSSTQWVHVSGSTAALAPTVCCYISSSLSYILIGLLVYGEFHAQGKLFANHLPERRNMLFQISDLQNSRSWSVKNTLYLIQNILNQVKKKKKTYFFFLSEVWPFIDYWPKHKTNYHWYYDSFIIIYHISSNINMTHIDILTVLIPNATIKHLNKNV